MDKEQLEKQFNVNPAIKARLYHLFNTGIRQDDGIDSAARVLLANFYQEFFRQYPNVDVGQAIALVDAGETLVTHAHRAVMLANPQTNPWCPPPRQ